MKALVTSIIIHVISQLVH